MSLNKNNAAVKRIMQEARELANDPCTDYTAAPLENDIFEWHCTLRGPAGTEFEAGLYHFRILLPAEYPFRPPSILMLTPNGRFELNTKICISFTNYHEELWQPAWGVRTAILGLQGFFPLKGQAAVGVGSIECPASERKRLALASRDWFCPHCQQSNIELLPDPPQATENAIENTSEVDMLPPSNSATGSTASSDVDMPSETSTASVTSSTIPITPCTSEQFRGTDKEAIRTNVEYLARSSELGTAARDAETSSLRRHGHKPPVLLDAAICILLVSLFAIICRRMV